MDPSPEVTPTRKNDETLPVKVGKKTSQHEGRKITSDPQNPLGDITSSIGKSSFSQRAFSTDNTIKRLDIQLLTTEEAAKLLPKGTFLVRKSVGAPGQYSVTWKTHDGKIEQSRLDSRNLDTINKNLQGIVKQGLNKYQFDEELHPVQTKEIELITSTFRKADLIPTPGLLHIPKIDAKVAESMLPKNSYLVRESSLPNLITLTIKDDKGHSTHQRLKLEKLPHIHEIPAMKNKREFSNLEINKSKIRNFKPYNSELAEVEFKENVFNKDEDLFCVRESPSKSNKFVLSVKDENGAIVHYDLESTDLEQINEEVNYINGCVILDALKVKINNFMPVLGSVNSKEEALDFLFKVGDLYKSVEDIGHPLFSLHNNDKPFDNKYSEAAYEMREFITEFRKGVTELTRLYLGNEVKVQSQNEIAFWKLSEHKGVHTHNEMKKLIPAAGAWAIYYNQITKTNMVIVNCTVTWGSKNPLFEIDKTPLNINPDNFREASLHPNDTFENLKQRIDALRIDVAGG